MAQAIESKPAPEEEFPTAPDVPAAEIPVTDAPEPAPEVEIADADLFVVRSHEPPSDEPPSVEPPAVEPLAPEPVAPEAVAPPPAPEPVPVPPAPEAPVVTPPTYGSSRPSSFARPAAHEVRAGDKTLPTVTYSLFLLGCLTLGFAAVPGVILAYAEKDKAPEWVRGHYVLMIRTFWVDVVAVVLGAALVFAAVGPLIWMVAGLWTAIRCGMGLDRLLKDRPYPNPRTWTV